VLTGLSKVTLIVQPVVVAFGTLKLKSAFLVGVTKTERTSLVLFNHGNKIISKRKIKFRADGSKIGSMRTYNSR
jgi:hypothetical protein